jgi:hypothetical protein
MFIFIYSLFNDAFIISDYIVSNERMIVNNELERMWKEAAVALFKELSRHLTGRTEETHENLIQTSLSLGRNLNPGSPRYEAEVITTLLQRSVQENCRDIDKFTALKYHSKKNLEHS